eukprot:1282248-Prymnesium_polylepis.1
MEFDYSLLRKGVKKMMAVVMEPTMRDTKTWTGVVGAKLGTSLYVDLSDNHTTASFATTAQQQLANEIKARSTSTRASVHGEVTDKEDVRLNQPLSH